MNIRVRIAQQAKSTNHSAVYAGYDISASGVHRVLQIANKKPYVVISASRHNLSVDENKQRNEALLKHIKEAHLYAYQMIGGYEEKQEEGSVQVVESSFFVPYNEKIELSTFIDYFQELRDQYDQDAILLGLPQGYDYKDWKPEKGLEIGGHYCIYNNSVEKVGTHAVIQTFDKYGSIAIDPKKDRIIEWVVAGVTTPSGSHGCYSMDRAGLRWFLAPKKAEIKTSLNPKAVQRALTRIVKLG